MAHSKDNKCETKKKESKHEIKIVPRQLSLADRVFNEDTVFILPKNKVKEDGKECKTVIVELWGGGGGGGFSAFNGGGFANISGGGGGGGGYMLVTMPFISGQIFSA